MRQRVVLLFAAMVLVSTGMVGTAESDHAGKGAPSATAETISGASRAGAHAGKHGYHKSFDGAEKWSKKFDDPARDKWQLPTETIKALNISSSDKLVDLGAGTGYFSLRIAKEYPGVTVYAADVEPDMIEFLKRQTEQKALANHIPLKIGTDSIELPSKVNLVLVVDTYHHIDNRSAYFGALKSQLLPNGRVAIIDFTAQSPEGPPPAHRISKEELSAEMKEAGYTMDSDIALLPYQYFVTFKPTKYN